jgi:DNA-binding LytR/AlgR family response regulator
MDIQLAGKLDGVETALRMGLTRTIPLIFLTSNSDDASFSRARVANPRAFISKPFRGRDLCHAIELALEGTSTHGTTTDTSVSEPESIPDGETAMLLKDRLFIRVKDRLQRLLLSDILWVRADDYYCQVRTEEREYLVTMTLKRFAAMLPAESNFLRCHRSYLVNLGRVTEIGEIYLFVNRHRLPVSRSKRKELLRRLSNR